MCNLGEGIYEDGIKVGEERGIKVGEKRGEERGIKVGEKRGEKRGIQKGFILTATNMLKENMPPDIIMKITGLDRMTLANLEQQLQKQ